MMETNPITCRLRVTKKVVKHHWTIRMIDMLSLRKGSTVLDLGCGTGYLTKLLSERVGPEGKVVAIDPDGERLKIASEKHSAPNIDYIQADDQTFPSGQYDVIFSNIVIHWISDKCYFRRVYDNLTPGGFFAFTTANGHLQIPEIGQKLFDTLVHFHVMTCHACIPYRCKLHNKSSMEHIPRAQPCSHIYTARLLFMNNKESVGSVDFTAILCSDTFD